MRPPQLLIIKLLTNRISLRREQAFRIIHRFLCELASYNTMGPLQLHVNYNG